jgi:hypothetical protein
VHGPRTLWEFVARSAVTAKRVVVATQTLAVPPRSVALMALRLLVGDVTASECLRVLLAAAIQCVLRLRAPTDIARKARIRILNLRVRDSDCSKRRSVYVSC